MLSGRLILALCSIFYLSVAVQGHHDDDGPMDNVLSQLKYDLLIKGKYDKFSRPVKNIKQSVPVYVGLNIFYINKLDSHTQTLTTKAWLKMNWTDDFLKWDPKQYDGVNIIRMPSEDLWKPDLTLYNSAATTHFLEGKSSYKALLYHNGGVLWVPAVTTESNCIMDIKNYPFDTQICNLTFGSWVFDRSHVDVQIAREKGLVTFEGFVENPEWELKHWAQYYEAKVYPCCPNEVYPSLTIQLNLSRRADFLYYMVILPSVLSMLLTLAMFWMPPGSGQRMTIGGVNLIVLMVLLTFLAKEIGSTTELPYAVMFAGATMVMTALALIFSVVALNVPCLAHVTRPPPLIMDVLLSPLRYFLFLFPHRTMAERKDRLPGLTSGTKNLCADMSAESEWMMVAMFLDRIMFFIYVMVMAIICSA